MMLLVPVVLAVAGLYSGRTGLLWVALALFVWLTWQRKADDRKRVRLWSVPADTSFKVSEYYKPLPDEAPPGAPSGCGGGCA